MYRVIVFTNKISTILSLLIVKKKNKIDKENQMNKQESEKRKEKNNQNESLDFN